MVSDENGGMSDLRPESMTWTVLLAKWMDFARSSVALPDDHEGRRWRDSVTPLITLQAVTFALGEVDELPAMDQPYAIDRAEVLLQEHTSSLERTWAGDAMPAMVAEIIDDARSALARVTTVTELIWLGPGVYEVPDFGIEECGGTLAVMQPGTLARPGEPIAWWIGCEGVPSAMIDGSQSLNTRRVRHPRQVYRVIDENGSMPRDIIAAIEPDGQQSQGDNDDTLPENVLPLLVPLFEDGRPVGHFTLDPGDWIEHQRAAHPGPAEASFEVIDRSSAEHSPGNRSVKE